MEGVLSVSVMERGCFGRGISGGEELFFVGSSGLSRIGRAARRRGWEAAVVRRFPSSVRSMTSKWLADLRQI